jgi:hypothetical protein
VDRRRCARADMYVRDVKDAARHRGVEAIVQA